MRITRPLLTVLMTGTLAVTAAACTSETPDRPAPVTPTAAPKTGEPQPLTLGQVGSLLPSEDDWLIADVSGFGTSDGEFEVYSAAPSVASKNTDGVPAEITITWRDADDWGSYVADRADVSKPETVTVLGMKSRLYAYGDDDFTVLRPAEHGTFIEFRGTFITRTGFDAALADLIPVTVKQFQQRAADSDLDLDADGNSPA